MKKDREERQQIFQTISDLLSIFDFETLRVSCEGSRWFDQPLAAIYFEDESRRGGAELVLHHSYPDDSWVEVVKPTPVQCEVFGAPKAERLFILESSPTGDMFGAWISLHEVEALIARLDEQAKLEREEEQA